MIEEFILRKYYKMIIVY